MVILFSCSRFHFFKFHYSFLSFSNTSILSFSAFSLPLPLFNKHICSDETMDDRNVIGPYYSDYSAGPFAGS